MEVSVEGRVAVVTGASRGIGAAIVDELLSSGARGVVVTGRRAETLVPAAERWGPRVVASVGNVSDEGHAHRTVATAIDRFGSCDLLVANAGTNPAGGALADVDLGAVDRTWDVNLRAPLVWARAAWHGWMRDHGGAIAATGSYLGVDPRPFTGAYNVSKAALHFLVRQLAQEFAPGVRVNAVAAGIVRTRIAEALWKHDEAAAARAHPLGRLGEPADVARSVVFLLSDAASWITGAVLAVDGGLTVAGQDVRTPD